MDKVRPGYDPNKPLRPPPNRKPRRKAEVEPQGAGGVAVLEKPQPETVNLKPKQQPPSFTSLEDGGRKLAFDLHPGQSRAWRSDRRIVLVLAGSQGGKTVFGPLWLWREIERCGDGDYLVVTATFPLLNLKVLPEFLGLFQDRLKLGTYKDSDKCFRFHARPIRIIFASASNPESIESATAKAAWLDEAGQQQFRRAAYEAIRRRLAIHEGRILVTTTPYTLGWLKTELHDRAVAGDPEVDLIQFPSIANPTFSRAEYERLRSTMPGWRFRMFHEGKFERPAGLIYDCFDRASVVIPRFEIPEGWLWHTGHDFGGSNPAAMLYAQDPSTGLLYAAGEYMPGSRPIIDQVADLKRMTQGRVVVRRVGGSHQEGGWRDAYTGQGWPITEPSEAVRDVAVGISRVYALHKQKRVMVFSDMTAYLDQIESYSYKLDDHYEPTEEIEDKASYHLMDAERYILSSIQPETLAASQAVKIHSCIQTKEATHGQTGTNRGGSVPAAVARLRFTGLRPRSGRY